MPLAESEPQPRFAPGRGGQQRVVAILRRGELQARPAGGRRLPAGRLSAGKPSNDHNVQQDGSPVLPSPRGAVPGAAGASTASYSSSHPVKNAIARSRSTHASR